MTSPELLPVSQKPALNLIVELCQALNIERIAYCHWKSNNALDRSASGENDLDLLVSRTDLPGFLTILARLGFKEARAEPEKQMIGVSDFYGYDVDSGRLVHVHAHYLLVLGHDMTKNFRLPFETPYIESAFQDGLFKVPAPEYEYIVLVVRLMLKHATWDVILGKQGTLKKAERLELEYLQARLEQEKVNAILEMHLPYIGIGLFQRCLQVLQPGVSVWLRAKVGQQLQRQLQAGTRYSVLADAFLKQLRHWTLIIKRRIFRNPSRHRLVSGGMMIAIVGGDGAGKTTLVNGLYKWLSRDFDTLMIHMGKPRESVATIVVRAVLRIGNLMRLYPHLNSSSLYLPDSKAPQFPGKLPWMIREAFKARDRYFTYLGARRFVNSGRIVICDRFPLAQIKLMDGPVVEQITTRNDDWLSRILSNFEKKYYQRMVMPELVIVLRLDPDEAVRRKTDEDSTQVRVRSTEIWKIDWQGSGVNVIEAYQSEAEVLTAAQTLIWAKL